MTAENLVVPERDAPARLAAMFDVHYASIWRVVQRLGVNTGDADDAAQRTFLVAARRLDVVEVGREGAYLYGVAVRIASEMRRRGPRETSDEKAIATLPDEAPGPEEALLDREAREALDLVLADMPDDPAPGRGPRLQCLGRPGVYGSAARGIPKTISAGTAERRSRARRHRPPAPLGTNRRSQAPPRELLESPTESSLCSAARKTTLGGAVTNPMKPFFFASMFLIACSGKTVELESSSSNAQALCSTWDVSFCDSGLPQATTLEAIRLMDRLSVDAAGRLDSACLAMVTKMGHPAPLRGVDAMATLESDCQLAHDLVAPVLGGVDLRNSSCGQGTPFGCVAGSAPQTCTATITVDDQNGKYALEADAVRGSFSEVYATKAELDATAQLTGVLSTNVSNGDQLDEACVGPATTRAAAASDRLGTVVSVSANLMQP